MRLRSSWVCQQQKAKRWRMCPENNSEKGAKDTAYALVWVCAAHVHLVDYNILVIGGHDQRVTGVQLPQPRSLHTSTHCPLPRHICAPQGKHFLHFVHSKTYGLVTTSVRISCHGAARVCLFGLPIELLASKAEFVTLVNKIVQSLTSVEHRLDGFMQNGLGFVQLLLNLCQLVGGRRVLQCNDIKSTSILVMA
jgi:hypothetical protein